MKRMGLAGLLLLSPMPALADGPASDSQICTDRPGKGNGACTVPAGSVQLETDLFNWSLTRDAGTRTDVLLYTNPVLKFGLSDSSDLQLNIAPYEEVRTRSG